MDIIMQTDPLGSLNPRLLPQVAEPGVLSRLARFERAAGRYPHVTFTDVSAQQQDAILRIDEEYAGGWSEDGRGVTHG